MLCSCVVASVNAAPYTGYPTLDAGSPQCTGFATRVLFTVDASQASITTWYIYTTLGVDAVSTLTLSWNYSLPATPSNTVSASWTPSASVTATGSLSRGASPSGSLTATATPTGTASPTATPSPLPSFVAPSFLSYLYGTSMTLEEPTFAWVVWPFDIAWQGSTLMGTYAPSEPWGLVADATCASGQRYSTMTFSDGDYCGTSAGYRTAVVTFSCGAGGSTALLTATEPVQCHYQLTASVNCSGNPAGAGTLCVAAVRTPEGLRRCEGIAQRASVTLEAIAIRRACFHDALLADP
jgi:hypothetical protein